MASWAGGEHLDEWYIPDADLRTKFCDALIDVSRFIEEIRFEIAYGALLIWDWDERLADGDAAEPDSTSSAVPFPIEALTLITSYMREPPPPTELFNAPYQKLSGERVLTLWLAGQLLDSALFRSIAALDRLAIMLRARAGLAIGEFSPAFRSKDLGLLASHFPAPQWRALCELLEHPIWEMLKDMRDGFTHRLRFAADLHGLTNVVVGVGPTARVRERLSADSHLAILRGFYSLVLKPAVDLTGSVLGTPPGEESSS